MRAQKLTPMKCYPYKFWEGEREGANQILNLPER